jgi:hypothetical protein
MVTVCLRRKKYSRISCGFCPPFVRKSTSLSPYGETMGPVSAIQTAYSIQSLSSNRSRMATSNDQNPGPRPSNMLGQLALSVSTSLVQIAIATLVGYWLDSQMGWMLWTPIGVCLGMALGMKTLLSFVRKATPQIAKPEFGHSKESLDPGRVSPDPKAVSNRED